MMKHAVCIFLCIFLAGGFVNISLERLLDFRVQTVSQAEISVQNMQKDCFIISAMDNCESPVKGFTFTDESTGHKISDAILPGYVCAQSNVSSKLLKLKVNPAVREILRSLYVRLSVNRCPSLSFTPSSIRYSYGYYIYSLAHILI